MDKVTSITIEVPDNLRKLPDAERDALIRAGLHEAKSKQAVSHQRPSSFTPLILRTNPALTWLRAAVVPKFPWPAALIGSRFDAAPQSSRKEFVMWVRANYQEG